jgi:hypothetical protein
MQLEHANNVLLDEEKQHERMDGVSSSWTFA